MPERRTYLARHLRTLSLHLMEEGHQICRQLDPVLEPSWGSILAFLEVNERVTVTEAARHIGVSHVHAQKQLKSMKKAQVVLDEPDPNDGRRTLYRLTERGVRLLPVIKLVSGAIDQVIADIETETGDAIYTALISFREALEHKSWNDRITEKINNTEDLDQ